MELRFLFVYFCMIMSLDFDDFSMLNLFPVCLVGVKRFLFLFF